MHLSKFDLLLLGSLLVCSINPSSAKVRCQKCAGADCVRRGCVGDYCFFSRSPLISSVSYPDGQDADYYAEGVQGCVVGISNPFEVDNECLVKGDETSGEESFCMCGDDKCTDDLSKLGRKTEDPEVGGLTCKSNVGEGDSCGGALNCWVARLDNGKTTRHGCSYVDVGIDGRYCIAPATLDVMMVVPPGELSEDDLVCFCRHKDYCNDIELSAKDVKNLDEDAAVYSLKVEYNLPNDAKISHDSALIWVYDRPEIGLGLDYEIDAREASMHVQTELTDHGKIYFKNKEWNVVTSTVETAATGGDALPISAQDEAPAPDDSSTTLIIVIFVVAIVVIVVGGIIFKVTRDKVKAAQYQAVS